MNNKFEEHFKQKDFTEPTLIQSRVYQLLRDGESVIGLAPTGSGKTLAFTLPLLEKIIPGGGTQLMIVSPSQELAIQTTEVVREWASLIDLSVSSVTGGANLQRQIERLKKKPEIVVGTPGRIATLIAENRLKTKEIATLIIDEADELLTDETLDTIRQIEDQLPSGIQLGFFSATQTEVLDHISDWFDVTPTIVDVRKEDKTQGLVQHGWIQTNTNGKIRSLQKLSRVRKFQALVFFNHVSDLEKIAATLKHVGVKVGKIAGHQFKTDRATSLREFKQGKLTYLLATDIAARGLDIDNLPAVINFDVPKNEISYTHRIGRTGRMGRSGYVISFGNDHDLRDLRKIMNQLALEGEALSIVNQQIIPTSQVPDEPVQVKQPAKLKQDGPNKTKKAVHKAPANEHPKNDIVSSKKHKKNKHSKRKGMRRKNNN